MTESDFLIDESCARVGIFLCECGGCIADTLNMAALSKQAARMPGVVYVHHEAYPCSKDGRERMRKAVIDQGLDRVLVAGCAPRLVEKLFNQSLGPELIEPGCLQVVNIRELAAFIHSDDPQAAFQKAFNEIEMGAARLTLTRGSAPHFGPLEKSALVVGSGLSGLTVAFALAERQIPVALIEPGETLGESLPDMHPGTRLLTQERLQAAQNHPLIKVMANTHLIGLSGHPGQYEVRLDQAGQVTTLKTGAILISNVARPKRLGDEHWLERGRVKTQSEFAAELEHLADHPGTPALKDVVLILCAEESQPAHCSRVCCNIGIRQAKQVKQLFPDANVTVLFRELYLPGQNGSGEGELIRARSMGVTFFRYRAETPPVIGDRTVDVQDILTGEPVRIPSERVVLSMPLLPLEQTRVLAALLGRRRTNMVSWPSRVCACAPGATPKAGFSCSAAPSSQRIGPRLFSRLT
jgi:heterodisulfide reductase subunit A2